MRQIGLAALLPLSLFAIQMSGLVAPNPKAAVWIWLAVAVISMLLIATSGPMRDRLRKVGKMHPAAFITLWAVLGAILFGSTAWIFLRLSIDAIYPFLRYSNALENYDGSTQEPGNDYRILRPGKFPPVRLHQSKWSKENPPWFDFGVYNDDNKTSIHNVMLFVTFLDDGLTVTIKDILEKGMTESSATLWGMHTANKQFSCQFRKSINAHAGLNPNGILKVFSPRPARYRIRIDINAEGFGGSTTYLDIIVE